MPYIDFIHGHVTFDKDDMYGELTSTFIGHQHDSVRGVALVKRTESSEAEAEEEEEEIERPFSSYALSWSTGPHLILWDIDQKGFLNKPVHRFVGHRNGIDRVILYAGKSVPGFPPRTFALSFSRIDEKMIMWNLSERTMLGSLSFQYPLYSISVQTFDEPDQDEPFTSKSSAASIAFGFENGTVSVLSVLGTA